MPEAVSRQMQDAFLREDDPGDDDWEGWADYYPIFHD